MTILLARCFVVVVICIILCCNGVRRRSRPLQPGHRIIVRVDNDWKRNCPSMSSIAELNSLVESQVEKIDMRVPLKTILRSADLLFKQARVYYAEKDYRTAYIMYLKFATLTIEKLPQHREFKDPAHQKQIKQSRQWAGFAMDELDGTIKPLLTKQFELLESARKIEAPRRSLASSSGKTAQNLHQGTKVANSTSSSLPGSSAQDGWWHEAGLKGDGSADVNLLASSNINTSAYPNYPNVQHVQSLHRIDYSPAVPNKAPVHSSPVLSNPLNIPPYTPTLHSYSAKEQTGSYQQTQQAQLKSQQTSYNPSHSNTSSESSFGPPLPPPPPLNPSFLNQLPPSSRQLPPPPVPPPPELNPAFIAGHTATALVTPPPIPSVGPAPPVPKKPSSAAMVLNNNFDTTPRVFTEGGQPLRPIFLPRELLSKFLNVAAPQTKRNLETCGIITGVLRNDALYVTTLIIPKQIATSDTCSTEDEEGLFEAMETQEVLAMGWIHTHPTQTCFMSSVDLHTHCSYQLMLPEAIAVVMAPTDSPPYGVFRLSDPMGINLISNCTRGTSFHPHPDLPNGVDIYRGVMENQGGHVQILEGSGNIRVIDLRN